MTPHPSSAYLPEKLHGWQSSVYLARKYTASYEERYKDESKGNSAGPSSYYLLLRD